MRRSTSYPNALKVQGIADYGYADTSTSSDEEDHLLPSGRAAPRAMRGNLWPEPYAGSQSASPKDGVETTFKNVVCSGRITLAAARSAVTTDWTTALAVTGIG